MKFIKIPCFVFSDLFSNKKMSACSEIETTFVSQFSIELYNCEKQCEECLRTYVKHNKFVVMKCCGELKRFCLSCE